MGQAVRGEQDEWVVPVSEQMQKNGIENGADQTYTRSLGPKGFGFGRNVITTGFLILSTSSPSSECALDDQVKRQND